MFIMFTVLFKSVSVLTCTKHNSITFARVWSWSEEPIKKMGLWFKVRELVMFILLFLGAMNAIHSCSDMWLKIKIFSHMVAQSKSQGLICDQDTFSYDVRSEFGSKLSTNSMHDSNWVCYTFTSSSSCQCAVYSTGYYTTLEMFRNIFL